ncbi:leucine-rich repeat protein kinase family protein [Artemisia annua]|uniref:Leucine-rich repeat protein kinase family protein n=1 Tax=Artemisia annua TaxID=35608 RepID=A0A2U1QF54_ARTAN|nr:leucine-rich repeat protein kinase family protein [Artemisia annua]
MTTIDLSDNQLNGSIPESVSYLPFLQRPSLENKFFDGSIACDLWKNKLFSATADLYCKKYTIDRTQKTTQKEATPLNFTQFVVAILCETVVHVFIFPVSEPRDQRLFVRLKSGIQQFWSVQKDLEDMDTTVMTCLLKAETGDGSLTIV